MRASRGRAMATGRPGAWRLVLTALAFLVGAVAADTTAPNFYAGYPALGNITGSSFTLTVKARPPPRDVPPPRRPLPGDDENGGSEESPQRASGRPPLPPLTFARPPPPKRSRPPPFRPVPAPPRR